MDFAAIPASLLAPPLHWRTTEVSDWLQSIGLSHLVHSFRVDGACLKDLDEQDLEEELSVTCPSAKRLLLDWIKVGFQQFQIYLQNIKVNQVPALLYTPLQPPSRDLQLLLTAVGSFSSFFWIGREGGNIGRHIQNNVQINLQTISRFHAQIRSCGEQFFVKDLGSSYGTYLKINDKLRLQLEQIIQIGSNVFKVQSLELQAPSPVLTLLYVDGPLKGSALRLQVTPQRTSFGIGRNLNNFINLNDAMLSNYHAKIHFVEDQFLIEDMNSTNGTWLRLGKDGLASEAYPLANNTVIKFGISASFKCQVVTEQRESSKRKISCLVCCDEERDALLLPCRHNTCCLQCAKYMQSCPVCRSKIKDLIKIYRR